MENVDTTIQEPIVAEAQPATSTPVQAGEVGGIDILVAMAERGEIDPKSIDIIDVADRFLKAIALAPKENLRQSGRILFHASVLLRMKAEALLVDNLDDIANLGDDYLDYDEDGSPILYDSKLEPIARQITLQDLERALVRRSNNRQMRERKVTLDQLIEALRDAEKMEKDRAERKPRARIDLEGQPQVQDFGDILELAHDEDIETVIARVEVILNDYFEEQLRMELVDLIIQLGIRGDWVDAFLAVLFLSNAGKITLEQEKFYGPLFLERTNGVLVDEVEENRQRILQEQAEEEAKAKDKPRRKPPQRKPRKPKNENVEEIPPGDGAELISQEELSVEEAGPSGNGHGKNGAEAISEPLGSDGAELEIGLAEQDDAAELETILKETIVEDVPVGDIASAVDASEDEDIEDSEDDESEDDESEEDESEEDESEEDESDEDGVDDDQAEEPDTSLEAAKAPVKDESGADIEDDDQD